MINTFPNRFYPVMLLLIHTFLFIKHKHMIAVLYGVDLAVSIKDTSPDRKVK